MLNGVSRDILNHRIERIEWARWPGERPRAHGRNARLGEHGQHPVTDLVRLTAGGLAGFGWAHLRREQAQAFVGRPLHQLFREDGLIDRPYRLLEFPLLDWLGRATGRPVYELVAAEIPPPLAPTVPDGQPAPTGQSLSVPCYDTSLYMDDLHLDDDGAAVRLMQAEAREGWQAGHRAFKIKVGRGARHMPLAAGLRRDIQVILGIREALGPAAQLLIDANNGYNLNLTKEVLAATVDAKLFWIEEPFHEDPVLYEDLKAWLSQQSLATLIADGEGEAASGLVSWAKRGLVDVLQYDIRRPGFTFWLELARELQGTPVKVAPHNYGGPWGNYASCHLAPALPGFLFVEWDEVRLPGLAAPGYSIVEGNVQVPRRPGFGLELDEAFYASRVRADGWTVQG